MTKSGFHNGNLLQVGQLYCGACTLHLSGNRQIVIVSKFEMASFKITVRAADLQVAKTLAQIYSSYLLEGGK